MQLTAYTVKWESVVSLKKDGRLEEVMRSDEVDSIHVGDAPWPSDSCIQYSEVDEAYQAIRGHLTIATRSVADTIMASLINEHFQFPHDLGADLNEELIAGSISPSRVIDLLTCFAQLDYAELDSAFDHKLPENMKKQLQIARDSSSEDNFTGYLRQWEAIFRYAHDNGAGILLHMG